MTYAQGQWTPDGEFKLPDGVAFIETDICNFYAETSSTETYNEFKTSDTTSLSIDGKYKVFSASYSQKETKVREEMFNNKKSISKTTVKCQFYDAMHFNNLAISPFFQDSLSKLPTNYDAVAYRKVINDFGTHFRKRISLGGRLEQLTFTNSEYFKKYSMDSVTKQASASFYVSVSASSEHKSEITEEFKQSSTINQIEALGGKPWISGSESWTIWASSIPEKPEVIWEELYPISDIITDPSKKANYAKAIDEYLNVPDAIIQKLQTIIHLQQ